MYACLIQVCPSRRCGRSRTWSSDEIGRHGSSLRRSPAWARRPTFWSHDPYPWLLALPERLLHVRCDGASPDRSRGTRLRVRMADIEALNSAAFAGRRRRHETELPRLRLLRRRLRAAGCRQRARAELRTTADFAATHLHRRRSRPVTLRIAIPGRYTTANFLLEPRVSRRDRQDGVLFSDIEAGVLDGGFDAGLIIHENRFTYDGQGAEEDRRPWRVLGVRDGRRHPARRHRHQPSLPADVDNA